MTAAEPALSRDELVQLVRRVFRPGAQDRALGLLVDLPDATVADHAAWSERRRIVSAWWSALAAAAAELGLERVSLVSYRNARRNNAELPAEASLHDDGRLPDVHEPHAGVPVPFARVFDEHTILIAPTEFSATAPLKLAAGRHGFRAATMPGFCAAMLPALRLDFTDVQRRCTALKDRLDPAVAAHLHFEAGGARQELRLDLRHRVAVASGGLITEPGTAGNLPSGETYIVPYEGERPGEPSRSRGQLPLELDGELLIYEIEGNRVAAVRGTGPVAAGERAELAREPAYANVAELGFGLLASYGIRPIGELLLDEKLGLHVAFGRSDHFGGSVGAADFSAPDRAVHIDRVYIPEVQPRVRVGAVDLEGPAGEREPLMRDGAYV